MPRGSKPGERRGGRQKGTPNKRTVLLDSVSSAMASTLNVSPLNFMLALMRDPRIPINLRLDMAVAAAPYVHAKPHAPSKVRTDPMHCDAAGSRDHELARSTMEKELRTPENEDSNRPGDYGRGQSGAPDQSTGQAAPHQGSEEATQQGVCQEENTRSWKDATGSGTADSLAGKNGNGAVGVTTSAENWLGEDASGQDAISNYRAELSPLQFLLNVMADSTAAPLVRMKAARAATRYKHAPVTPDKLPGQDEYGFTINRTLAMAIKDDWLALIALGISSKAAPKRAEIRGRQAQRDEFLRCPPNYSPERDLARRDELVKKIRRSLAEETELAHVVARITASKAAFNRSPEGQIHRRIEDLQYRRKTANQERNRRVGLTRAEGKELDDLLKMERDAGRWKDPRERGTVDINACLDFTNLGRPAGANAGLAARPDESDMEELAPTVAEILEKKCVQEAELIKLRRASGHPDPWDGNAPLARIYELEARLYLAEPKGDLTPAEAAELRHITRIYPEEVEKMRKMVERRLYGQKLGPRS